MQTSAMCSSFCGTSDLSNSDNSASEALERLWWVQDTERNPFKDIRLVRRPSPALEAGECQGPVPNMSPREALGSLAHDFRFNQGFCEKVEKLQSLGYRGWRRIRGDGNCFYRALGFGMLERMATAEEASSRAEWGAKICRSLSSVRLEDAHQMGDHDSLLEHIRRLTEAGGWGHSDDGVEASPASALQSSMSGPDSSLDYALVRALRYLAAGALRSRALDEDVGGGISFEVVCQAQGYDGVEDFCQRVVLPMGTEAEGVVLDVLPEALGVGLRIALLDRASSSDVFFCDYNVPAGLDDQYGAGERDRPTIHLQLRPGHYDLLYFGDATLEPGDEPESPVARLPSLGLDDGTEWTRRLLHIDTQQCYAGCARTGCL